MRAHGFSSHPNPINPYAAAAEKAIATQRAKQVREKLLKRASAPYGSLEPDQAFLVDKWMAPTSKGKE